MCASIPVFIDACIYACTYTHIYIYVYTRVRIIYVCICLHVCITIIINKRGHEYEVTEGGPMGC